MATFTVTNTNNSGAGSLRQEILDANALSGKDIINFGGLFNDGLAHTISLTASGLSITDDLTIQGTNPNLLTIKDNSATPVFNIASGATATINGLTITNSYSGTEGGGAISNDGVFTLNNSIITGNTTSFIPGDNGGIYNNYDGSLTINYSTISDNTGGGIYNNYGSVTVNYSTISDNTAGVGGGIDNEVGRVTVNYSAIIGNTALYDGGGINNGNSSSPFSTITVNNSIISDNHAGVGGGIADSDFGNGIYDPTGAIIYGNIPTLGVAVTNSIISGNSAVTDGGGIYTSPNNGENNVAPDTISVSNSIISGNSSGEDGGGIYDFSIINLSNSIISGNTAKSGGGGIYNGGFTYPVYRSPDSIAYGNVTVIKSIISDNSASTGGGIYNYGTLSVSYSSISHNSATNYGGGIYNSSFNEFSVSNPDFNEFSVSKPDFNEVLSRYNTFGIVNVSHSNINGNQAGTAGGGIYNDADQDFGKTMYFPKGSDYDVVITYDGLGIVKVSDSTISGNQAHFGGGIYNDGTLTVDNSIIKHNRAFGIELSSGAKESGKGGGIYNNSTYYATATLNYSTIACNFDTPQEDSTKFIKLDNLVGNFIKKGSLIRV